MRKFFSRVWNAITFPFRWLGNLIARPFRAVRRFMMTEPTSQSIADIFAAIVTDEEARKVLWEEIEKFRGHLLRSVVALFAAAGAAWYFIKPLTEFLAAPVGGQKALQVIDLTEGIGVYMKVAFTVGLAIAIIYIAFEFWFYAAPGLTVKERWNSLGLIPLTAVLFWTGVAFTYFFILPPAVQILQTVGDFQYHPTANTYYSLVTRLLIWIGLFFEFPMITTILTRIGIVTPKALASQWRLAIIIIGVIAALITPTTDMGSMAIVMAPMIVLYFISIGMSFLVYRKKKEEEILPT